MTAAVLLGEADLGAIRTRVALRGTSARADAEFAERAEQDIEELLAKVEELEEEILNVKEDGEENTERHGYDVATNAVAETMALFGSALEALYFCQGLVRLFALLRAKPARAPVFEHRAQPRVRRPSWLKVGALVSHPRYPKPGVVTSVAWPLRTAEVDFGDVIPRSPRRVSAVELARATAKPSRAGRF